MNKPSIPNVTPNSILGTKKKRFKKTIQEKTIEVTCVFRCIKKVKNTFTIFFLSIATHSLLRQENIQKCYADNKELSFKLLLN